MPPCIADSDCISLEVDGSSNLVANIVLSAQAGNALECLADGLFADVAGLSAAICNGAEIRSGGLWVPQVDMSYGVTGPPTSGYTSFTKATPTTAGGAVVARSGAVAWTAPDCADAIVIKSVLVGPTQFASVTPGGRIQSTFRTCTYTEPAISCALVDGAYCVYHNSGTVNGEIAFPAQTSDVTMSSCPAGLTQTMNWQQTYQVTAGTIGTITMQSIFIYVLLLSQAS